MISRNGQNFDIVLISGEYWDDHPGSPVGIIARVLEAKGHSVGIIERPKVHQDITRLGRPRLFFGVTAGSIDSMVHNYTPLKRRREDDPHSRLNPMPDRALLVYCNHIKQHYKDVPIVIGGIEASLRRFAHYDYWDNKLRRSILLDSRANILVYGSGEKQVIDIAARLKKDPGSELLGIPGTCVLSKELLEGFSRLPSWEEASSDRVAFCEMQASFSNEADLAQEYTNNFILQFRSPSYTPDDLDWIYGLDFSRKLHPDSFLGMAKFSVTTHRGCFGACSFCALSLHQGNRIVSRSEESILSEIRRLTRHSDFRGYIDDLGGPSANMYGMDCLTPCLNSCLACGNLHADHSRLIFLMKRAREIPGVKKIFVRSGVRYDLAVRSKEYVRELARHHVSGCLKVAPEHFSPEVLNLMNKSGEGLEEFTKVFRGAGKSGQELRHYLMVGHPGDNPDRLRMMLNRLGRLSNVEQFQLFTPTPMTNSSCMYWTGLEPRTLKEVVVVRDYHTKKVLKRMMLEALGQKKKGAVGRAGGRKTSSRLRSQTTKR